MSQPDLWHRPRPGTLILLDRCLTCCEPVVQHPSWWARLKRRFSG
jgi:hypothetical protein